jgi:Mn2+/Fe2+ NRAMP family transporter
MTSESSRRQPPERFIDKVKYLGPGLIISGAIVGSGELIATTALGAQVGFVALWMIIFSCLIKVVVQEEWGRYTISSGDTPFRALNKVPRRLGPVSWVIWCWAIVFIGITMLSGGIVGGTAQVLYLAFPQLSVNLWVLIIAGFTAAALVFRGKIEFIQTAATVMVLGFTVATLACAIMLQWTPYAMHFAEVVAGLKLELPAHGLQVAFGAFGLTGLSAGELVMYPYWCLEKGYARFVGQREDSAAWTARAQGWLRVLKLDVVLAMILYTAVTVAFYFLGAAILHKQGLVPNNNDMVRILSQIYTTTFGPGAFAMFLAGAFAVLYSTFFVHVATFPRLLIDLFESFNILQIGNNKQKRTKWLRIFTLGLVSIYVLWYWLLAVPVTMVVIGGALQAALLPILAASTLYWRYKHLDPRIAPSRAITLLLWIATILMAAFAIYTIITSLQKL